LAPRNIKGAPELGDAMVATNSSDDANARAARYRGKAATVREAAALAEELISPTLLRAADSYDRIASSLEETASQRLPPAPSSE
jgi:hypothetical protein